MGKSLIILFGLFFIFSCNSKTAPSQTNPVNAAMENTRWNLVMLTDFPVVLPAADQEIFMMLEAGKFSGFGGCNNFSGNFSSRNETIRFSEIRSTKMYCEKYMDLETAFLLALQSADKFTVTGMQMELHRGYSVLARFEAIVR